MDRLVSETLASQVTQYTYDNNGNMLSRVSAIDRVFNTWDFDNRLIAADTDGDGTADVRNAYDAWGVRVSQTVGAQETRFLIDTVQRYPQVALEYHPGGLVTVSYVYGNRLISQARGGARSFYHVDGLHSTRALTGAAGVVTARYTYDAFGRILVQTGSTVNSYLFAGQQHDSALGLDYLRARYYDPSLGRFTAADPLRGSLGASGPFQIYAYANNNPLNLYDPAGLAPTSILDVMTTVAKWCALLNAVVGFVRAGPAGAGEGFITGYVQGLVLGGAIGTLGRIAFAIGGEVAAGLTVTILGTGLVAYGAATSAVGFVKAIGNGDAPEAIAEGINLLVAGITAARLPSAYGGKASGAETPVQQGALDKLALEQGVNIEQISPGDLAHAGFRVTSPVRPNKLLILPPPTANTLPYQTPEIQLLAPDDVVIVKINTSPAAEIDPTNLDPNGRMEYIAENYFSHVNKVIFEITQGSDVYFHTVTTHVFAPQPTLPGGITGNTKIGPAPAPPPGTWDGDTNPDIVNGFDDTDPK
jgi:RHS repeat-associated protein